MAPTCRGRVLQAFGGTYPRSYPLHTVVESATLLHRQPRADIHFMLAGPGDQMPALRRAASLRSATITGWLDQRALTAPIEAATAGLCAAAPRVLRALPHKPDEAAGLPGISSRRGELADVARTEGIGRRRARRPGAGVLLRDMTGRGC